MRRLLLDSEVPRRVLNSCALGPMTSLLSRIRIPVRHSIEPNGKMMTMTKYIDGFVLPIPKEKIDLYREHNRRRSQPSRKGACDRRH